MGFIDTIFSSVFYMTLIIMVWTFGFVGLGFLNPFKNKTLNFLYKAAMYIIASLIMIIPTMMYYGLADDFRIMTMGRTTICVEEEYEQGGGESASETVHRLTVLDKNTGERKERRYIGYTGKLLGQKGDTVIYFYNHDLVMMNAASLEKIDEISLEEWGKRFPALQEGVDEVYDNQNSNEPQKLYIRIRGKNGNSYWFEPFSKKLFTEEPKDQRITGIYSTGYDLYSMPAGDAYQQNILRQEYQQNSERKKIAPGEKFEHLFGSKTEESFIEPAFLCIDTVKKCFVFRHYRTTDRKEIWIEAKDFNFKTLWKKDSEQLGAKDSYSEDKVGVYKLEKGFLYFNMAGFVICLDPLSGKEKWKVRL